MADSIKIPLPGRENSELILRPLLPEDAAEIFRAIDTERKYLGRWLPFVAYTRSVDDSRSFVEATLAGSEPVFTLRLDGVFIGLIGFKETAADHSHTEIGYWMCEQHQGHGYMTAAARAMVLFAFTEMGITNEVFIRVAVGNTKSRNIPQRLGFRLRRIELEGEFVSAALSRDVEVWTIDRAREAGHSAE
jgi:ribosomal-protein-serine acetyltransferase